MCAEANMSVCSFTTPANLFHAMRRQVKMEHRRPLVIMSPKSLLRHPGVVSTADDLTASSFREVIPADAPNADAVKRIVFCSGKVYLDLLEKLTAEEQLRERNALVRIEQFYPFPAADVATEVSRFPGATEFVWCQEEPRNMGAWTFISPLLDSVLASSTGRECGNVQYRGRAPSASPSSGSAKVHQLEQERLIADTLK